MSYSLRAFFIFTFATAGIVLGVNRLVDPLQFYHKANKPVFLTNQRYQIPGLIRNYEFDSIIVGTSLSENFRTSHVDDSLSSRSINLSIGGSSAAEQASVVRLALASGKVRRVIWEINYRSFGGDQPNLASSGEFPLYLYEHSWRTHIKYLFAAHTIWWSVKKVFGAGPKNLEMLNYWGNKQANRFDGTRAKQHFCAILAGGGREPFKGGYDASVRFNLLPLITASETEFYLYLPPVSYLNFLIGDERVKFESLREEIYRLSCEHENVRVYDFMRNEEIVRDLSHYKDVEHYSPAISQQIIARMARPASPAHYDDLNYYRWSLMNLLLARSGEAGTCPDEGRQKE